MKSAFKYHGLGNDFVLLDWMDQPYREASTYLETSSWATEVQELCDREHGIGADGVIVILKAPKNPAIRSLIYNSDGSYASFCGNGARCVAAYLHQHANFPASFKIMASTRIVDCHYEELVPGQPGITTLTPPADYLGLETLNVGGQQFQAHKVDVGNPHLVILQRVKLEWLKKYGKELEYYFGREQRHNIEFIWPTKQAFHYTMLVHERGAGITQACGSGAMAATVVLEKLGLIKPMDKTTIHMLGGSVITWLNSNHEIALHGDAQPMPLAAKHRTNDKPPHSVVKSTA
ncbi:MAG: diaminopimelate epimerase [Gammaproteobacteria bacterium]|nr:diaminopimelate epimerase [Gammaproteobacteria bacterium]